MRKATYILLFIFFIVFGTKGIAQLNGGSIKIRKTDQSIIGKTLSLFDLRTQECGTIFFEDEQYCQVNFIYEKEELKNLRVFLDNNNSSKVFDCSYSILSDTSFIISWDDYSDTCSYTFVNEENNMVKFLNTPQGQFEDEQFAFFYGFDSVVYSQSYLRSLSDFAFTDSILFIDSVYNTITDPEKREELTEKLKIQVDNFKDSISYNYFVGRYKVTGKNRIDLLNTAGNSFGVLFFQVNNGYYNLFTHSKFDVTYPVISQYTHSVYGRIILNYDSALIEYHNFNREIPDGKYQQYALSSESYLINQSLASNPYFYKDKDTLYLINNVMSETVKFKDVIGGYYPTTFQSKNGIKLNQSSLFFTGRKAISTSSKSITDTLGIWSYTIQNGVFYLYNEKDTLVDEMKNGLESFRFTYRNNQPFVFGAYQRRIKNTKESEFLLLFENDKGVKFTCDKSEYKMARESILTSFLQEQRGITYEHFKYSASDEYLWIEYENGGLEEFNFFNFNKAIRIGKGKKMKNYYLVD